MIPEYKKLVIKDISARVSYGVKFACNENVYTAKGLDLIVTDEGNWEYAVTAKDFVAIEIDFIKPYLFPLSSMTEEQKEELFYNYIHNDIYFDDFTDYFLAGELWHDITVSIDVFPGLIDWFNLNHFDYRGLIEKGLAIDATGKNIY
jgi:hypothetical protein